MRKLILISIFMSFFSCALVMAAVQELPANAMPLSKIVENLQSKGYIVLREIEFQNGFYVTKALNYQGADLKIRVNPQTGEVVEPKAKATTLSILDIANKLEDAGYHSILKLSFDHGDYEAVAFDKEGKRVDLDINGRTGQIVRDWF